MRRISVVMIFLIFLIPFLGAQVDVASSLDNNKMLIGDQCTYRIELKSNQILTSIIAEIEKIDTSGKIEILNQTQWSDSLSNIYSKEWTFTCFDSGYYQLLPIPIMFSSNGQKQRVFSKQLAFFVDNPLIDSSGMADIKSIIEEPATIEDYLTIIYGFIGLLIAAFLIWFFVFKKKKRVNVKEVIVMPKPAHELALNKLQILKERKLWQQEKVKEYYSELTFIAREYLEKRYEIRALEFTTHEILDKLKTYNLNSELQLSLKNILHSADIVKFAKGKPAAELHEQFWAETEAFILKTKQSMESDQKQGKNKTDNSSID